ncbi:MAG: type II secretion system minor pseudopilin GspJ [Candidatus Thiodiazotropha sp.]
MKRAYSFALPAQPAPARGYQQVARGVQSGFTLLELLIAITIFAIIATFVYSGLKVVLDTEQQTSAYSQRMTRLQLGLNLMQRDIIQVVDRPVRDQHGDSQPALSSGGFAGILLELTRDGYANPMKLNRSNLQRVGYQFEDQTLYRVTWPVLDRAQDTEPKRFRLFDQVSALEIIYYDEELNKLDRWPPEIRGADADTQPSLPLAIEINLELKDWGAIRRIFPVSRKLPDEATLQDTLNP